MEFLFRKRITLLPGLTLNLGKNGFSLSVGPWGAKVTIGQKGIRQTFGIPGTGLSYSSYEKYSDSSAKTPTKPLTKVQKKFSENNWLTTENCSFDEKRLIQAIQLYLDGLTPDAFKNLSELTYIADAAFIYAALLLKNKRYLECSKVIEEALHNKSDLGKTFRECGLDIDLSFPITDILVVNLKPSELALFLMKVETLQHQKLYTPAYNLLTQLYGNNPDDLLIKISLTELILISLTPNKNMLEFILKITNNIENVSAIHTVLMYYRALAFKELKLYDAAQSVLSIAGRKTKNRDPKLLLEIYRLRAQIFELQGKYKNAQTMNEKIMAYSYKIDDSQ